MPYARTHNTTCLIVFVLIWGSHCKVHEIRSAHEITQLDKEYTVDHWARVSFSPVPAFFLDTHDPILQDVYISGTVHKGVQTWDPYIWDRLMKLTPKSWPQEPPLFVDVGANLGYFSLAMASLGYRVIAFEPMTRNAWKLARSVSRNSLWQRVTLYQNAVTATDGAQVRLRETDKLNQGNGQVKLLASNESSVPKFSKSRGIYGIDFVDTVTLSSVMLFSPIAWLDAFIVKIDVEGFEAAVLQGARGWVCSSRVTYIILEFSEATRTNLDFPPTEMFAFMQKAGYTLSDVSIHIDKPIDYAPVIAGDFTNLPPNLLFSRPHEIPVCS